MKSRMTLGIAMVMVGLGLAILPKAWVEERFGFEPDGGNGVLELLLTAIPIMIGVVLLAAALVGRGGSAVRHPTQDTIDAPNGAGMSTRITKADG